MRKSKDIEKAAGRRNGGMSKYTHHPKRAKNCVFCNNWIGDAQMKFKNSIMGYEYEAVAKGKCTRRNGAVTSSCYSCQNYEPSMDAKRLL